MRPDELVTKNELQNAIRQAVDEIKDQIRLLQSQSPQSFPEFYRNKDLKLKFGFSDNTIRKMRISGELPFTKIGTITLYPVNEISEVLKKNMVTRHIK